ncbi:MAG: glycoside hydrolase family 28 protein [Planctomycetota bacterium]|nr:glycoside hydrolase family 28 protein [Planctomycetota bacterium]
MWGPCLSARLAFMIWRMGTYSGSGMRRALVSLAICLGGLLVGHCPIAFGQFRISPIAGQASSTFNIVDYGAIADGKTLCSNAINSAITSCDAAGGGRVLVPAGTYLTGPIVLRSGVEFHLDAGAIVLFSRDFDLYPMVAVNWEGRDTIECQSPISGDSLHDVSITGSGVFDGQGDAWRSVKKSKLSGQQWNDLVKTGGLVDENASTWYPSKSAMEGRADLARLRASTRPARMQEYVSFRDLLRPCLLLLSNCRNVRLEGVTFRNSPCWNLHLFCCDNVSVRNVTAFNYLYAQNGDGIDVDSCRNVTIADCTIDAGDDDICLKSGKDEEGRKRGKPTENVTISNCDIGWGHGGVTIGSEMSGGVRNVLVSNCIMKGTDIGLRFKTTRGRGGTVENVSVNNIVMSDITSTAILFDMYYMEKQPHPEPVSERTPIFRQFDIRNVVCRGAKNALEIRGLEELPIEGITLEHVRLTAESGGTIWDGRDITLRDVHIEAKNGPALQTRNVKNLISDPPDSATGQANP